MKLSKQEIQEELAHKREIIAALVRRRRPLELQAAQRGLSTPPEILTEISTLTDQIRAFDEDISRLETLAAEGQLSIVEAEYRVMLARALDTPRGKPTLAGSAELELARLKMGLLTERSQQIEREVRVSLAEEAFSNLDTNFLDLLPRLPEPKTVDTSVVGDRVSGDIVGGDKVFITGQTIVYSGFLPGNIENPYDISLRSIGRAIRLDTATALRLFLIITPPSLRLDIYSFGKQLIVANRVWNYQDDREIFERFLAELTDSLDNSSEAN